MAFGISLLHTVGVLFGDWALVLSGVFGQVLSLSTSIFDSIKWLFMIQ